VASGSGEISGPVRASQESRGRDMALEDYPAGFPPMAGLLSLRGRLKITPTESRRWGRGRDDHETMSQEFLTIGTLPTCRRRSAP
jgi:hypothetical protein